MFCVGGGRRGGSIGGAVPGVAVACRLTVDACVAVVHRKVQRHHTVAAVHVVFRIDRCGGRGIIGDAVPSVLVADSLIFRTAVAMVHGKIQRVNICADGTRLAVVVGVHTRGGIGLTVPVIFITHGDNIRRVVMHTDIKVQCVGAGTPRSIHVVVSVNAGSIIRLAVPAVAVAGRLIVAVVAAVVQRQVQRHHTVAPRHVLLRKGGSIGT